MDVASINRVAQAPNATAPAIPVEQVAENRQVIQAVKALNRAEMFGGDNELTFSRDRETKRMVVQLVDRKTDEVISQIPPEYVLRLANGKAAKGA